MTKRTKSALAGITILLLILLMGYVEALPYSGQKCNWASDCDFNETCRTLPYYQRDGSSYTGICVPKEW